MMIYSFSQFGDMERALLGNENVYNGRIESVEIVLCIVVLGGIER